MKKSIIVWAASAVLYLGVVIAGYSVYASMNPKADEHTDHAAAAVQKKEDAATMTVTAVMVQLLQIPST